MEESQLAQAWAQIDEEDRLDSKANQARAILTDEYFMNFKHEIEQRRPINIACWFDELGLDYFEMMSCRLAMLEQDFLSADMDDVIMTMWMMDDDYKKIQNAVDDILVASPNFEEKVAALVERAERGEVEF